MIDDIKKLVKAKKVIIGTGLAIKGLKAGKVKRVFLTSNCPDDVKQDIMRYARFSKVDVVQLSIPNDELGVACKKQFAISVIAERS